MSYTLTAEVEHLVLTGTGPLSGTGNDLDNTLIGTTGNNTLDGSAGADTLDGGRGDDLYIVDNLGDIVKESAAGFGVDTVEASVSYTLAANVDHLTLTGGDDIDGTGNGLANIINGNSGNNILDGGAGADAMS
ncbi:calcium-binding protein, partial [Corallococcus exiguus]|uniref:calcium-binding protein n=1 Tax=Corallococcus exiguus TaxID=83462 RepID=UPI0034CF2190